MEDPSPLSAFCYSDDEPDHPGYAPTSSERPPPLWSKMPQPNRARLLRVLSRLVERQLQAETTQPEEAMSDEFQGIDVPKPVADGRAVVGHAV